MLALAMLLGIEVPVVLAQETTLELFRSLSARLHKSSVACTSPSHQGSHTTYDA